MSSDSFTKQNLDAYASIKQEEKESRDILVSFEDYERERAEKKLLMKLREAEGAVKDGNEWLALDELKAALEG